MVLISIKFRQLWSQISLKILIPLRSNIKHSKECFIRYPTTSKSVKKLGLRPRFSTRFSVFGYPMKHSFSCLIYYIHHNLLDAKSSPNTHSLPLKSLALILISCISKQVEVVNVTHHLSLMKRVTNVDHHVNGRHSRHWLDKFTTLCWLWVCGQPSSLQWLLS